MFLAQAVHLLRGQAGVAEHAALGQEVVEVAARQLGRQHRMQALAHGLDALAHRGHVGFPRSAQRRVVQHLGHHRGGVQRRAGVVAAHGGAQLAQHQFGLGRVLAHHAQRAGTLTVQAHALAERVGDEERQAGAGQRPHRERVFVDALAVALVGQVQVGQQAAGLEHRDQLLPLGRGQVDAGGVVAASMHQHHAAARQLLQRFQHLAELHAAGGGVVVRVGVHRQAAAFEHRAVVVPGGVAHVHLRIGQPALDEVAAHLQAAAAAHGLQRGDAAAGHRLMVGAEQQRLHALAAGGQAFHRQVGLGAAFVDQLLLGLAHAVQHRNAAGVVEVDADRQIRLVGARVLLEGVVQAQDGVAAVGFDVLEHGHGSLQGMADYPRAASMSALSDSGLSVGA